MSSTYSVACGVLVGRSTPSPSMAANQAASYCSTTLLVLRCSRLARAMILSSMSVMLDT